MDEMKTLYQKTWIENKSVYIEAYKQEYKISQNTELSREQLQKAEEIS